MIFEKKKVRQEVRGRLQKISTIERQQLSASACALLEKQIVWQQSKTVLFYAPLPSELDVWPLLAAALASGKLVALPKFDETANHYSACAIKNIETGFSLGQFGVREPNPGCTKIPLNQVDLALVPGVGFDLLGRRIGRGRGFMTDCSRKFPERNAELVSTNKLLKRFRPNRTTFL